MSEPKKTRVRRVTKKQMSARVNINLFNRIDEYIDMMNTKGISTKKVDVIEMALLEFLEKNEVKNEKQ